VAKAVYRFTGDRKKGYHTAGIETDDADGVRRHVLRGQTIELTDAQFADLNTSLIMTPADEEPTTEILDHDVRYFEVIDPSTGKFKTSLIPSDAGVVQVQTIDDLPTAPVGNPITLVRDELTLYWYDGTNWVSLSGGGGGGAGPYDSNVLIQKSQPAPSRMTYNTLWVALDTSGVPLEMSSWKIYTGLLGGDPDGSLFIQETTPAPSSKALWIPLWPTGVPKASWEWLVVGSGSVADPHLALSTIRPSSPTANVLKVAPNIDGTMKPATEWEVYA
jgi:hypothetical protein